MGADNPRAALYRDKMRGNRAAKTLMWLRRRDRTDEALARGADQQRQAEYAEFIEPGQRRHALLRGFAEADAGVEHDISRRNARLGCNIERAGKEGGDILHDVDVGIDAFAVMHDDDGRT